MSFIRSSQTWLTLSQAFLIENFDRRNLRGLLSGSRGNAGVDASHTRLPSFDIRERCWLSQIPLNSYQLCNNAVPPWPRNGKPQVVHAQTLSLVVLTVYLLTASGTVARAQESAGGESPVVEQVTEGLRTYREDETDASTLSGDFGGLGDRLKAIGIHSTLNLWMLYQGNVSGGLKSSSDFNGLVYFSNYFDIEKIFDWKGASLLFRVDARWGTGVDDAVGSLTNINTLAVGDEPGGVTRLWFNQNWLDDRLRLRFGKLDITTENFYFHDKNTAFDAMDFANSPRTQFLAGSLVNNSTIPFPESGLGAMVLYEPAERVYVAGGAVPSDSMEYEWSNPFTGDSAWLFTAEAGTVVAVGADGKPGHYYAGVWGADFVDAPRGKGIYFGASQLLISKGGSGEQGLGAFVRFGYAQDNPNGIEHFFSAGGQYRGLFPGRDDILGLGWAQAFTDGARFSAPYEGVLELYYRGRVTPWLNLSPHIQYVVNPGSENISNALTLGLRGQITF